jgi:hypothetical protein
MFSKKETFDSRSTEVEPFSLFGFNLFESEETLQVNRSNEAESVSTCDDDSTATGTQQGRGFFRLFWEESDDNTDTDDESNVEELVPQRAWGVVHKEPSNPNISSRQNNDEISQRSNGSSLYQNLFGAPLPDESPKQKPGLWNLRRKQMIEKSERDCTEAEQGAGLQDRACLAIPWKKKYNPSTNAEEIRERTTGYYVEPRAIFQQAIEERQLENDRRDDCEPVQPIWSVRDHFDDRFVYIQAMEGQEPFKCFPYMPRRGEDEASANLNRRCFNRKSRALNGKLDEGDLFNESSNKKCFPAWPVKRLKDDLFNESSNKKCFPSWPVVQRPKADLFNESSNKKCVLSWPVQHPTDDTTAISSSIISNSEGREKSFAERKTPASAAKSYTKYHILTPRVEANSPNKGQGFLASYQPDFTPPRLGATLPMSQSQAKPVSHAKPVKQARRNPRRDSWNDDESEYGWFTLASLDAY